MRNYRYLIIGGGMTGDAAVRGIRQVGSGRHDRADRVRSSTPALRWPPLSKGLWKGKPLEGIWRGTAAEEATLHLGRSAESLDPAQSRSPTTTGQPTATRSCCWPPAALRGGSPPIGRSSISAPWTTTTPCAGWPPRRERFAVIGGGFIGSEIAAALAISGKQVVMIFPRDRGSAAGCFPPNCRGSSPTTTARKGWRC